MSTAAPEAPAPAVPFEFFDLHVVRTRKLGRSLVRVTLGGERLWRFHSGGRDQRFKLFLPHPGQDAPVVPTEAGNDWFPQWRAMDPSVRGIMRSYTAREQRRVPHEELDVDFVLHGAGPSGMPEGPASRWAATARPGDRVTLLGPVVEDNGGVDFRPPEGTDWVLLSGDETALPAIAGILGSLPPATRVKVWLEVPHAEDLQDLPTLADADITWLVRENFTRHRTDAVLDSVRAAALPGGTPYAWIAGEAGTVKALRRHLVRERGFDRRAVKFTGYWRLGATEEQLVEEAVSAAS
ncbi:siderophore-interacting protein [Streptomyces sp. ODS28]|uniref:siderophore-interacting protein n=1 Tax=Streptomyces sp. ODS28 TaxID=3136688 RepID=UPI0031EBC187